jgi:hypothetical protein
MKKILISLLVLSVLVMPMLSFAAEPGAVCAKGNALYDLICNVHSLINAIIPIVIALGVLFFVWGVVMYVIASDEEAKSKGRDRIVFAIIGLGVIVGMWGLVNIVVKTFDLEATTPTFSDIGIDAGTAAPANALEEFIATIQGIVNSLIPLLIAIGVIYFIWGVIKYLIADSEEAKSKGKDQIIYGIIGFTVILGLWGLVNILASSLDIQGARPELSELGVTAGENCTLEGKVTLKSLLCYITKLINDSIIPLIFAIATVFFIWGAVKFFIINADEEAKREQGKQFMIWSIVAFAVMLSVWGLVAILGGTLGIDTNVLPQVRPSTQNN